MVRPIDIDDGSIGQSGTPVTGSGQHELPQYAGKNLREGTNVTIRPTVLTSAHLYNLRNQSWAVPRLLWVQNTSIDDPISIFYNESHHLFPSNADTVNIALYANTSNQTTDTFDRSVERFNVNDLIANPIGTTQSAMGYFIIDALERGQSRLDNLTQLKSTYSATLDWDINYLPSDSTPGGASVLCEYSGRVFYAGFSGQVIGGDQNSPRMSSYILFSQLVKDISSISACYQSADPTSKDDSDLVDTDGGFIRVDGAYQITGLVNVGSGLVIMANNGIWILQGGSDYGFKATDYKVTKITSSGCSAPGSIVSVDNTVFYWGPDGIYHIAPNQFGDYQAENLTQKTIQTYLNKIPNMDFIKCEGTYDSYEKKIKWLFGNALDSSSQCTELTLDLSLGAYYPAILENIDGQFPLVVKGVQTDPFQISSTIDSVINLTQPVLANGDQVIVSTQVQETSIKEVRYLTIMGSDNNGKILYGFSTYNNQDHFDWSSVNGIGIDAASFLLTGVLSAGDFQRSKDVPYITFHLRKTETGFAIDENDEWIALDESSCLVQVQWDWTNDPISGKWGRQFQAYRHRRRWSPATINDTYNDGYYVVETKNKLRGAGKVMSLLIQSEPGKHMELLGWSMVINLNGTV